MCRENVVFTCAYGKRQSDLGDTLAHYERFAVDGIAKLVTYSARSCTATTQRIKCTE